MIAISRPIEHHTGYTLFGKTPGNLFSHNTALCELLLVPSDLLRDGFGRAVYPDYGLAVYIINSLCIYVLAASGSPYPRGSSSLSAGVFALSPSAS
jgi:hypothetical protein